MGDLYLGDLMMNQNKYIMESNINYIEDKCLAYPLQERISY